jgi:hypothetical protein
MAVTIGGYGSTSLKLLRCGISEPVANSKFTALSRRLVVLRHEDRIERFPLSRVTLKTLLRLSSSQLDPFRTWTPCPGRGVHSVL